ncbi:hypothetical protein NFI96_010291 [Prochilodus magdalenae]|nr:hypothetical protein NFI96_010291 [Prochilodus magdalenae]
MAINSLSKLTAVNNHSKLTVVISRSKLMAVSRMANYAAHGNPKNGFMVMTQAAPVQNMVPFGGNASNSLGKFLKGSPSALGTIQIMIGLFSLAMAFVLTVGFITFSTYSGVTYWGPVFYIISGSMTVAAGKRPTPCLVRGALGMNVWSAIIAGAAIILFSWDFVVLPGYDPCSYPYTSDACEYYYQFLAKVFGISGVLLVLSVLQFIISICTSAFGCRATCYRNPEVSVMTVAQNYPMTSPYGGHQPFQTHGGQQPFQAYGEPLWMANTAAPGNDPGNGFMVVTHVISPAGTGPNGVGPLPGVAGVGVPVISHVNNINTGPAPNPLQIFLKSKPTALGTIQIMIGVVCFLMSVVLSIGEIPFSIYSGINYWGPIFYIISGSLTVAAEKKLTTCLVKGSLGMNIWSAIVAGTAVILLSMDFAVGIGYDPCDDDDDHHHDHDYYGRCTFYYQFMDRTYGISGVLLILSLLQLTISISSSAFGCKATCCYNPVEVLCIANPAINTNNLPTENPPAYSQVSEETSPAAAAQNGGVGIPIAPNPLQVFRTSKPTALGEVFCFANPALNVNDPPTEKPPAESQISEKPDFTTKEMEKDSLEKS